MSSGPLDSPCPVCKAAAGDECQSTIPGAESVPERRFHLARSEPSVWVKPA